MLSARKPLIEKYLNPIVTPLSRVNPNILTLIGSIPPLLFFVCVITYHYLLAIIFFLGCAFDFLDGMVARKFNKTTLFGAFFDSSMDRISDFFIITAFSFGNIVRWEIAAPFLLTSFLISYIRSRSETLVKDKNVKFNIGLIERPERLIALFFAFVLYIVFPTILIVNLNIAEIIFLVVLILSIYTVIQRIMYACKKL